MTKKSKRQQAFAASAKVREQEKLSKRTMLPVQPARTEVPQSSNEPSPVTARPSSGNQPPPPAAVSTLEFPDLSHIRYEHPPEKRRAPGEHDPGDCVDELSPLEVMAAKIRARRAP